MRFFGFLDQLGIGQVYEIFSSDLPLGRNYIIKPIKPITHIAMQVCVSLSIRIAYFIGILRTVTILCDGSR